MWNYNYSDELYHYGIKGMKWGKRKGPVESRNTRIYRQKVKHDEQMIRYHKKHGDSSDLINGRGGYKESLAKNKAKLEKYEAKDAIKREKYEAKAELRASIERGKKVYQRIAKNNPYDPEKHKNIYDALNKKDAADYRAYNKNFAKKEAAVILAAMAGVTVGMLSIPKK